MINIDKLKNQKLAVDFDLPQFPNPVFLSSTVRLNSTLYFFGGLMLKEGSIIDNYMLGSKPSLKPEFFQLDSRLVTLDLSTYKWR